MLTPSPGAAGLSCPGVGGCSFSPPRLTLTSSGVPSTGLSEMGNDQTPGGFSNPTCGESDLQEAFEVPLLWCSF